MGAVRRPEAMDLPNAGPGPERGGRIVGAAVASVVRGRRGAG